MIFKTFGSIYIPKPEDVNKVFIQHFIYKDDICLRCLSKDRLKMADKQITWLDNDSPYKPTFGDNFRILGPLKRWKIHNQYYSYIKDNIKSWV